MVRREVLLQGAGSHRWREGGSAATRNKPKDIHSAIPDRPCPECHDGDEREREDSPSCEGKGSVRRGNIMSPGEGINKRKARECKTEVVERNSADSGRRGEEMGE